MHVSLEWLKNSQSSIRLASYRIGCKFLIEALIHSKFYGLRNITNCYKPKTTKALFYRIFSKVIV